MKNKLTADQVAFCMADAMVLGIVIPGVILSVLLTCAIVLFANWVCA